MSIASAKVFILPKTATPKYRILEPIAIRKKIYDCITFILTLQVYNCIFALPKDFS